METTDIIEPTSLQENQSHSIEEKSLTEEFPVSYQENMWHSMDFIINRENALFAFLRITQHILTQLKELEINYASRFKQLFTLLSSSCEMIDQSYCDEMNERPFVNGIKSLLVKFNVFADSHNNLAKTIETEYLTTIIDELPSDNKKFRPIARSIDLIYEKISLQLKDYQTNKTEYLEITQNILKNKIFCKKQKE